MTSYVALLRAVNVGGTGKLPMAELRAMCIEVGFDEVATYIASGNVVFTSDADEVAVRDALAARLGSYFSKACPVFVRTAAQIAQVHAANPFPDTPGKFTLVSFLESAPPPDALDHVRFQRTERIALGTREIYIAYPDGVGSSKLQVPAAATGTARNINTVAKLADLAIARD
ncbi:MAG: DUF1697 domain-containing protein [Cumulibacter sp.]